MFFLKKISQKNNHSIFLFFKYILPIFLIGIGMFQTYRESFLLWYQERDEVNLPEFISEIHHYGWSFIKDYNFGVNNQFFSLIVPAKFLLPYFDNKFSFVAAAGAITFWITAFLTGIIIYFIIKNKRQSLWAMAFILMAPFSSLGDYGYLVHSCAHNVSLMWGLWALFCYLMWIKYNNYFSLFTGFLLLTLTTFSDPWLFPTFIFPLICTSISILYLNTKKIIYCESKKTWIGIIISSVLLIILCKTNFLGLFKLNLVNISGLKIKVHLISIPNTIIALSYYLNFIPFNNLEKFTYYWETKNILYICLNIISVFINSFIISSIFYLLLKNFIKNIKSDNKEKIFFFIFLIFSSLGIISSTFIFGKIHYLSQSRYLINIFYAFIFIIFISSYKNISSYIQKYFILSLSCFLVSSIISNHDAYNLQKIPLEAQQEKDILSTLKKENITYAYGNEIEAKLMTLFSDNKVHVSQLVYSNDYHGFVGPIWSSPLLYDLPNHTKWAFILESKYRFADSSCIPFPSCQEAIIHQFGQPIEVKYANRVIFYIYNSDGISPPKDLNESNWHLALPITQKNFSRWQSYYPNNQLNLNDLITFNGWDWEHIYNHDIQTNNNWASFIIPIPPQRDRLYLRIKLKSSTPGYRYYRDVDIVYKNNIIAQWRISESPVVEEFNIPIDPHKRNAEFKIHILNPDKDKKSNLTGITLSEVQVVEDN